LSIFASISKILSNNFWLLFVCARIKLAIREAEIQKLHANLTVNQLSQNVANDSQECGKVNTLETEPVKLGGSQVGEYITFELL
jgi:hypothetical protein